MLKSIIGFLVNSKQKRRKETRGIVIDVMVPLVFLNVSVTSETMLEKCGGNLVGWGILFIFAAHKWAFVAACSLCFRFNGVRGSGL